MSTSVSRRSWSRRNPGRTDSKVICYILLSSIEAFEDYIQYHWGGETQTLPLPIICNWMSSGNAQLAYRVANLTDVQCPACQQRMNTIPQTSAGRVAYMWCFTLLFFTGVCCCMPFLIEGCKDISQKCSNCGEVIRFEPATCCTVEEWTLIPIVMLVLLYICFGRSD